MKLRDVRSAARRNRIRRLEADVKELQELLQADLFRYRHAQSVTGAVKSRGPDA